jgi:hypothetical protein
MACCSFVQCTVYLCSEIAPSQKLVGIEHMHTYTFFFLGCLILWRPRILTFPPGTPCVGLEVCTATESDKLSLGYQPHTVFNMMWTVVAIKEILLSTWVFSAIRLPTQSATYFQRSFGQSVPIIGQVSLIFSKRIMVIIVNVTVDAA